MCCQALTSLSALTDYFLVSEPDKVKPEVIHEQENHVTHI